MQRTQASKRSAQVGSEFGPTQRQRPRGSGCGVAVNPGLVHSEDRGASSCPRERLRWTPGRLFGGGRHAAATRGGSTRERFTCFGGGHVGRHGNSAPPSGGERVARRTRTRRFSWIAERLRRQSNVHGEARRFRPAGEHAARRGEIRGAPQLRRQCETDFTSSVSALGVSPNPELFGATEGAVQRARPDRFGGGRSQRG